MENCREFREASFPTKKETKKNLQVSAKGYVSVLYAVCLEAAIVLDDNMRENYPCKKLINKFELTLESANEIFFELGLFDQVLQQRVCDRNRNVQDFCHVWDLVVSLKGNEGKNEKQK